MNSTASNRTRSVLAVAALTFATLSPAGAQLAGQLGVLDLAANGGINPATGAVWAPGDTYRLVFLTSTTTDAASADITTYNTFVQGVAAASTAFPDLGNGTWNIVGSTVAVDARDNTGTNPGNGTGVAVFLMDGATSIANDNADLWDGGLDANVSLDENGNPLTDDRTFTGSFPDGTSVGDSGGDTALGVDTDVLGKSGVQTGNSANSNGGWMRNFKAPDDASNSVYAMSGLLTVVDLADTTPPTLAGSDIVDDKSPAAVEVAETVTYTVTFSEAMDASTVEVADFKNNSTATATISVDSVSTTGDPAVFDVAVTPAGTGTLNLQVKAGAELKDVAGNALNTASAIADDTTLQVTADLTAPSVVSFDDNVSGGPVLTGASVTYTVTFSEAMNATTVQTADFVNNPIDDAMITVDTVTATGNAAVFDVTVTTTGAGTLNLQVAAGATLLDTAGNALVPASANPDDTVIDVNDPDTTAPNVLSFDDNADGGPVTLGDPVTYTVTFSEAMDASTVNGDDFENNPTQILPATITVDSVATTGDPAVFDVTVTTTGTGTLQLQVASTSTLEDLAGNALVPASANPDNDIIDVDTDTTLPTVSFTGDNVGGGPILVNGSVTYTVTFSEAMDAGTIGIDDFQNSPSETSTITVDGVGTTGNPAVFEVTITATTTGTIILQIKAGADMRDLADNALDTNSAIPDSSTITVNEAPDLVGELGVWSPAANGGINPATGTAWAAGDTYRLIFLTSATTDATSADITTYNTFVQGVAAASTTFPDLGNGTWNIVGSTVAVDARDNTNTNPGTDGTGVGVFLMDGISMIAASNADLWNSGIDTNVSLDENGAALSDDRTFTGSFPNGTSVGDSGGDTALGVDTDVLGKSGVQTGNSANSNGGWMRNFKAPDDASNSVYAISEPLTVMSGGGDYATWAALYPDADLSDPEADYDGDGVSNDGERLFGLDPTDPASQNPIAIPLDAAAGTLSFTRRDDALTGLFSGVETSTDLLMWTEDTGAVLTPGAPDANGVETVAVELSDGLLAAPKLFVRIVQDDGTVFSENFEDTDGGFTPTGTPNDWAWGRPQSMNAFLTVDSGNGESEKAWGTNLGDGSNPSGVIVPNAVSVLRSPDINLTDAPGAELQFAAAGDISSTDAVEVLVKDVTSETTLVTVPFTIEPDTPTGWTSFGPFDISAAVGSNVYLEFRYVGTSDTYLGLYIDDVSVRQTMP